jgi:PhnB protein
MDDPIDADETPEVRLVPEGYGTVTPWIVSLDAVALIAFVERAFGARELGRVLDEDGKVGHAEFSIGDSIVMTFDAKPEWPATPAFLRLYVPDADAVHRQAIAAGATSVTDVTRLAFGDRVGRVRDPQGNLWWIQTYVEDVAPDELAARWSGPTFRDAMRCLQDSLNKELNDLGRRRD